MAGLKAEAEAAPTHQSDLERTAAEYSNVLDRQRLRRTSSGPLTCLNDRERPRSQEFASRGSGVQIPSAPPKPAGQRSDMWPCPLGRDRFVRFWERRCPILGADLEAADRRRHPGTVPSRGRRTTDLFRGDDLACRPPFVPLGQNPGTPGPRTQLTARTSGPPPRSKARVRAPVPNGAARVSQSWTKNTESDIEPDGHAARSPSMSARTNRLQRCWWCAYWPILCPARQASWRQPWPVRWAGREDPGRVAGGQGSWGVSVAFPGRLEWPSRVISLTWSLESGCGQGSVPGCCRQARHEVGDRIGRHDHGAVYGRLRPRRS